MTPLKGYRLRDAFLLLYAPDTIASPDSRDQLSSQVSGCSSFRIVIPDGKWLLSVTVSNAWEVLLCHSWLHLSHCWTEKLEYKISISASSIIRGFSFLSFEDLIHFLTSQRRRNAIYGRSILETQTYKQTTLDVLQEKNWSFLSCPSKEKRGRRAVWENGLERPSLSRVHPASVLFPNLKGGERNSIFISSRRWEEEKKNRRDKMRWSTLILLSNIIESGDENIGG